ncbi:MCE family protein [Stagnimonas aquatica]|uniref:MCE family protein n=1 Tax=Stagnimonas aquatica TaxID=2689987 RepID=A0A3N0VAT2_9GAMM|nr:MlaD family protein [Stagnimonas aquatica]ROH89418.1 MCE family protein [Stagnimonas aquatica]
MGVSKANPTAIGAFVLGALALVAVAIITLGGSALFTPKQRAVVFFEGNVNGLVVGAPVNFRGVKVGSVDRIALQFDATTLNARIPVYLSVLPNQIQVIGGSREDIDIPFEAFIQKGLRAKLNMESIVTGQLGVDLDFRPNTPLVLVGSPNPSIPEIPTVKSDFDVIKDQLSQIPFRQIADDVKTLVASISELSKSAGGSLGTLDQELRSTATAARKTLDQASRTLATMDGTLAAVRGTADKASATLDVAGPQLNKTLSSAEAALSRAEKTLSAAEQTLANTAELTAPGAPLRADLEQALRDLAASAESLRSFADTVERNPNALVFGN